MLEQYLVRQDSLENVEKDGKIIGYRIAVKSPGYRGNFLSLCNGFYLVCDGERVPGYLQSIEINGKAPRSFEETKKAVWEFWNMGEEALLHVQKPGGLERGFHTIELQECNLEQYGYGPNDRELLRSLPEIGEHIPGRIVNVVKYRLELK